MTVRKWADDIKASVGSVFLGKEQVVENLLASILCGGHVLLEDVPGVGKTILARAIARSIGGKFNRIQCTPDLLPTDILGVSIYNPGTGNFNFRKGPILANVVLVDEINRATPRTQSALLEAMAEKQISVDGQTIPLPSPFFIIATENPIEFEGTFPLPEAQKDRFFLSTNIGYPDRESELAILEKQRRTTHPVEDIEPVTTPVKIVELQEQIVTIHVDKSVKSYIMDIIENTREEKRLSLGVSPRGTLALYKGGQALAAIRGRDYVVPEDVKDLVPHILSKRMIVKSEYLIKGIGPDEIISSILKEVPVPILKERL
ncbi:MAG: MoxR family ATPase [Spirochaetales bacterium]|jgi:MoxR-like ATPase|nr:MoxR family ATPase [Spirochaetales bacterium]